MALKIIDEVFYPILMESESGTGRVVLAVSEYSGIILKSNNNDEIGSFASDWMSFMDEEHWKPYNKSITFCNQ